MLTRCQENDLCGQIAQARQFVGCKPVPVWARGESRADGAFSEWIVRQLALKVAEQLRGSGIKIAIDDFGAGYSSFSSLRELPFIEFKLDGSFVKNCAIDATNAAICQTAIDLAHRFGSAAVAEGIETAGDLHALDGHGLRFRPRLPHAPPMPQERFLDLLRQRAEPGRPSGSSADQNVRCPDAHQTVA